MIDVTCENGHVRFLSIRPRVAASELLVCATVLDYM